jgi:hypothetical protein
MPYKFPEVEQAYQRRYRESHRPQIRERLRRWYAVNRTRHLADMRRRYAEKKKENHRMAKSSNIDDELTAVKAIVAAVEPLDPQMRSRVIQAAQTLLPPPQMQPPMPPPQHAAPTPKNS